MIATFESLETKEQVETRVEHLIYRLLEMASDCEDIDRDSLLSELEDFAGREYIIHEKLRNNFTLDDDDREYLCGLINERKA